MPPRKWYKGFGMPEEDRPGHAPEPQEGVELRPKDRLVPKLPETHLRGREDPLAVEDMLEAFHHPGTRYKPANRLWGFALSLPVVEFSKGTERNQG